MVKEYSITIRSQAGMLQAGSDQKFVSLKLGVKSVQFSVGGDFLGMIYH